MIIAAKIAIAVFIVCAIACLCVANPLERPDFLTISGLD